MSDEDDGADDGDGASRARRRAGPGVVAPSNRVNVALPFGSVHVEEPSKDVGELAAIVAELAAAVERSTPGSELTELRERSEALALRLR